MADAQEPQPQTAPSDGIWVPALKEAGVAFVAATLLLTIFYFFAFRWIHPEFVPFMDREATKLIAPGKDLIPVSVGGYRVAGNSAIIEDFNGDEAILLLNRGFQAEDYPFIRVNLKGLTRFSKAKILWRQAHNLSGTHSLEFNRSADEATQIAMVYGHDNYRGRIADIALLFYDGPALGFENNNDVDIVIESIKFKPFSARSVAEQIFEDWTNPPLWRGYSNNIVVGIHGNGMLFPNTVANLLVLISVLVAMALRVVRRQLLKMSPSSPKLAVALCLCLYGWAFNDIFRWHWRVEQLIDTHERYNVSTISERALNNPLLCTRYPKDCRPG